MFLALNVFNGNCLFSSSSVPIIPDFIFSQEHPDLYLKEKNRIQGSKLMTALPTSLPESVTTSVSSLSSGPPSGSLDLPLDYSNKTVLLQHLIAIYEEQLEGGSFNDMRPMTTGAPSKDMKNTEDSIRRLGIAQDLKIQLGHVIRQENVKVGILFGSKAFVQLLTNPFVGMATNRSVYILW